VSLFASWHSRYAPGVQPAKAHLAANKPSAMHVIWKEDVRQWHPNQDWIGRRADSACSIRASTRCRS
jgi:D-galactose 1-dehydrogenase